MTSTSSSGARRTTAASRLHARPGAQDGCRARAGVHIDRGDAQTGIGLIPSEIAAQLAATGGGDYGVHSEMFTDGLMQLHEAGKVTNQGKGQFDGRSVVTFAMGSEALYRWLEDNHDVAFLRWTSSTPPI